MLQKLYVLFANPNEWPATTRTTTQEDVDDGGWFCLSPGWGYLIDKHTRRRL